VTTLFVRVYIIHDETKENVFHARSLYMNYNYIYMYNITTTKTTTTTAVVGVPDCGVGDGVVGQNQSYRGNGAPPVLIVAV